jgi:hypothetical protein
MLLWAVAGCGAATEPQTSDPAAPTSPAVVPVAAAGAAGTPAVPTTQSSAPPPTAAGPATTATPVGAATPASAGQLPPSAAMSVGDQAMAPSAAMPAADDCGLKTTWQGDSSCIKAPPSDKGFQLHVGPASYDNPDPKYVLAPGGEVTESFTATSSNTSQIYYYYRQYRMRPGSHHMILNSTGAMGRRIGGSQNLAWDEPQGGVIAPENQGVGMTLGPNTPFNVNLHYFNVTDKPILKEVWINFWYRDPKDVTTVAKELFSTVPMNVAPGQHVMLTGTCPITDTGHILTLYGHRHANNQRFAAYRERAGKRELVLDDYDWTEPALFQYSSTITNTPPDPANKKPGGWSGILDVMPGDNIVFECDIVNMTNSTFHGQNEAMNDEMCILVGDTYGVTVPTRCTLDTQQL